MLLLGFYTKGFTALFPFVLPFIYRVVFREGSWKQVLFHTGLMLAGFLLPLSLLWPVSTEAYTGFIRYFEVQVIESLTHLQTVQSRFYILGKLFMELLIPLLFCVVLFVYGIRKNLRLEWNNDTKWAVVFILTGLAGVIPIMISMKQSGFYILATFPLFAMGPVSTGKTLLERIVT